MVEMTYVFTWSVEVNLWNMTIACALRYGVAYGRGSPYLGKHLRCWGYTNGQYSFEAVIIKKANMWLC